MAGLVPDALLPLADPKRSRISEIPVMGDGPADRTRNPVGQALLFEFTEPAAD